MRTAAPILRASALAASLALAAAAAAAEPARPQRVASINLCADQLLMLLAEPERIASVTFMAQRQETSPMAEAARAFPANRGRAEEIIPLGPDLVLAGAYTARAAVAMLRRLGHRVVELAPETSFADIRANILTVGEALGEPDRAAALVAAFDAELAALTHPPGGDRPVFADVGVNASIAGTQSLSHEAATRAGFDTVAGRLGHAHEHTLGLEGLIVARPDVLSIGTAWRDPPALATQSLDHPALRALAGEATLVDLPDRLLVCGTPATLDIVRRLGEARRQVGDGHGG
jgi:iron complex transport system substrate-binding protein